MESLFLGAVINAGSVIGILGVLIGLFGMAFGSWFFGKFLFRKVLWSSNLAFNSVLLACLMIPFVFTMLVAIEIMLRIYVQFFLK
jgi:hypothetical protein